MSQKASSSRGSIEEEVLSNTPNTNTTREARFLTARDRDTAHAYLSREPQLNLALLDMIESQGRTRVIGEVEPLIVVAWDEGEIIGVAALRPSLVFDAHLGARGREVLLPFLGPVETGLVKSLEGVVTPLWDVLRGWGRRSLIDRIEIAYTLRRKDFREPEPAPEGARVRRASISDLAALVHAARESLREESRPDPFESDPIGFERWVRGRIDRARLVEYRGEVAFVGYADVQRPQGWLVQGVFTWPEQRRLGIAAAGMAAMVREAFEAGAEHIQLAVVEGNGPALALYHGLGFHPFGRLRTVLFV
jgi:ribosomal protein S18 acetylase RimI-like enzyme